MPTIFIDADACPVKDEVYKVAKRYGLTTIVVSNSRMRVPFDSLIRLQIVDGDFDAADDWIAAQVKAGDIVTTNDVPLASRCTKAQAHALSPSGRIFTEENMRDILVTRDLLTHLRSAGMITGGPPPFSQKDRSRFLMHLDALIQKIKKTRRPHEE